MARYEGYIGCLHSIQNICVDCGISEASLKGSFNAYVPLLLQVEGGYQNNPEDNGNWTGCKKGIGQNVGTMKGISACLYKTVLGRTPTVADMKAITTAQATQIYLDYFWNPLRGNEIKSQAIANTVVDHHVNSGRGVSLAQQVLNKYFGKNLKVDNGMGPITLAALNSVSESAFVPKYNEARAEYYGSLSNSNTFLAGWLKRLESFAVAHKSKILGFNAIVMVALFFFLMNKLESDGGNKRQLQGA